MTETIQENLTQVDKNLEKKIQKAEKKKLKEAKKLLRKKLKEEKKLEKGKRKSKGKYKPNKVSVTLVQPKKNLPLTKALLIGINYNGTNSQLNGCINDMDNLSQKLSSFNLIKKENMTLMTDNLGGEQYPTKKNILTQLESLVQYAVKFPKNPVQLFVAYSGHGTYLRDNNGDEIDGQDEALCPVDYDQQGFITDDYLNKNFLSRLPANVKLVMLIDACHSGTMGDLKYNYKFDGKGTVETFNNYNNTVAEIVMISGCTDVQTSADAYIFDPTQRKYEYQGAMTASFLATLQAGITSANLITNMRTWLLNKRMSQIVQFSSGKQIIPTQTFLLTQFK